MKFLKYTIIISSISLLASTTLAAQIRGAEYYNSDIYIIQNDTMPYRYLTPKEMKDDKKYPLIIFLHGSGERGHDNELQLTHGAHLFANEDIMDQFPAFVLFPQCQSGSSWNNTKYEYQNDSLSFDFPERVEPNLQLELLEGIINQFIATDHIDTNRIYIGGLSMGGMGTFDMLLRNPNSFACAFSICGGANPSIAPIIHSVPMWIFHGDQDSVVPVKYSLAMYESLHPINSDTKLTIYKGVDHDSWTNAFADPSLIPWLMSFSLK